MSDDWTHDQADGRPRSQHRVIRSIAPVLGLAFAGLVAYEFAQEIRTSPPQSDAAYLYPDPHVRTDLHQASGPATMTTPQIGIQERR